MVTAGIIGGAGYTAGELIRILLHHEQVHIDFIFSTSNAGNPVYAVHQDLIGSTDLVFTSEVDLDVDVLFLCLGHGNSTAFLEQHQFSEDTKIIDLSNDFRLKENSVFQGKEFVYGLPELQRKKIKKALGLSNSKASFSGAAPIAVSLQEWFKKLGVEINQQW